MRVLSHDSRRVKQTQIFYEIFWAVPPGAQPSETPSSETELIGAGAEAFDPKAKAHDQNLWYFRRSSLEAAYQNLEPLAGKRLLEIGPGSGRDTLRFAQSGARVAAVDLTRNSLRQTRHRLYGGGETVLACQADAHRLPFPDQSFDRIFASLVLMHLDWQRLGAECARVLAPGGEVVFVEPLAWHPVAWLFRQIGSLFKPTQPRYFRLKDIPELAGAFDSVHHQEFYLTSVAILPLIGPAGEPAWLQPIRAGLDRLDNALFTWVPWFRTWALMAVIVLRRA
ncbi:MAG: class I SAM-dependent methyltransferase [Chloroflexi bacterium]|nr:class I SAM-dependent methyltransferase [Chloroflexota bacterium]